MSSGTSIPDKPHFAHRPADEQQQAQKSAAAPPSDPDRPTLHERPHTDDASNAGNAPEDTDPDRPTFHRQAEAAGEGGDHQTRSLQSIPIGRAWNTPHPQEQEKLDKPDALFGLPAEMNQIVGVSDPKTTDSESWTFSWSNSDDAAKMKADLEAVAEQALAPPPAPAAAKTHTAAARRNAHAKKAGRASGAHARRRGIQGLQPELWRRRHHGPLRPHHVGSGQIRHHHCPARFLREGPGAPEACHHRRRPGRLPADAPHRCGRPARRRSRRPALRTPGPHLPPVRSL